MIYKITQKITQLEAMDSKKDQVITELNKYKDDLTAYNYVQLARHERRPKPIDFIQRLIKNPVYLKGDRNYGDDTAIIGGIGMFGNVPVTFVGTNKGRDIKENVTNNFGMARPEGYRKSLRLMKQAEKFQRPIITFVDTAGAYPGVGAEERGQGESIAVNLLEMSELKVPIISVITGEGGSGGALALSVADQIIMMEFSVFSILSPEGFASIMWKDSSRYKEATEIMKLTSKDLLTMGIVDHVIDEDIPIGIDYYEDNFKRLEQTIHTELRKLQSLSTKKLVYRRKDKFKKIGVR